MAVALGPGRSTGQPVLAPNGYRHSIHRCEAGKGLSCCVMLAVELVEQLALTVDGFCRVEPSVPTKPTSFVVEPASLRASAPVVHITRAFDLRTSYAVPN